MSLSSARSIQSMLAIPLPEYYPPINAWVFQVVSFPQVSPPKPCMHPYVLRAQPTHAINPSVNISQNLDCFVSHTRARARARAERKHYLHCLLSHSTALNKIFRKRSAQIPKAKLPGRLNFALWPLKSANSTANGALRNTRTIDDSQTCSI